MITLKTKQKHNVPFGRGIISTEVYLKVSEFKIDENGVQPQGYYYIVQDDQPHELDKIVPSVLFWEQIEQAETQLSAFTSNSLKNAIYQRAKEFALAKLQQEGTENYGIAPEQWEIFVAPEPELENHEEPVLNETDSEISH
ncbi:hypothetical protein ACILE2_11240 [Capnocytophaga canimorsus]|uniref:hypothetical protein n=1 Tax=Capnocytophaga canimorsus TaxID=28188 RepID=UPI00249C93EA|nr:hypothetical protein [Capnocytophaga canimorsus]WGU70351.1 hypothetical protein QIU18_13080 [Capnocytophaga canimorsus]